MRKAFKGDKGSLKELALPVFCICLIGLVVVIGLFFNRKMNTMHHIVEDKVYAVEDKVVFVSDRVVSLTDGVNALDRFDVLLPPVKGVQTYSYNFGGNVAETRDPYDPAGLIYDWTEAQIPEMRSGRAIRDDSGIVMAALDDGFYYHPLSVASIGLYQYSNYLVEEDEEFWEDAVRHADFIVEVLDPQNGCMYYPLDDRLVAGTDYRIKAPWPSAISQGRICSLMARMYYATGDKKYLEAAQLAMRAFDIDISDGGVTRDFMGHPFYEEYPAEEPIFVLNGFMDAIIGLYDVWHLTGDETAERLYKQGIETLVFCLPYYDINGVSLYHLAHLNGDLIDPFYTARYHTVHVARLLTILEFEENETLRYYCDKWIHYVNKAE